MTMVDIIKNDCIVQIPVTLAAVIMVQVMAMIGGNTDGNSAVPGLLFIMNSLSRIIWT